MSQYQFYSATTIVVIIFLIFIKLPFLQVCNTSFGVAHQGKRDVERHLSRAEHVKKAKVVKHCQPMTSFCTTDDDNDKVTSAEVLFTSFILEHNLPFESASHAAPLFRKMFPDSKIAKKYGCAATKTAAIVNYALAPEMLRPVVEYMRKEPFSLAIDGSSDTGTESMYPLVVRIFDINTSTVGTKLWHVSSP